LVPDLIKTNIKVTPSGQITIGKAYSGKVIRQMFIIFGEVGDED